MAFRLFCTPRKGKVLPTQAVWLEMAKSSILMVRGTAIQTYHWKGGNKSVLLIHGWESNTFRWRTLVEALQRQDYNILAFDGPAHGFSGGTIFHVPLYTECLQQMLLVHRANAIIAHSVGGMAAIYHQYRYPRQAVEQLVTIGSPADLSDIMSQYQSILRFSSRVHRALDAYFSRQFGFGINGFSTAHFVRAIKANGLLIHDKLDTVAPVSASEQVNANWENSQLILTEGLGHSLHQDEVNMAILNFLGC